MSFSLEEHEERRQLQQLLAGTPAINGYDEWLQFLREIGVSTERFSLEGKSRDVVAGIILDYLERNQDEARYQRFVQELITRYGGHDAQTPPVIFLQSLLTPAPTKGNGRDEASPRNARTPLSGMESRDERRNKSQIHQQNSIATIHPSHPVIVWVGLVAGLTTIITALGSGIIFFINSSHSMESVAMSTPVTSISGNTSLPDGFSFSFDQNNQPATNLPADIQWVGGELRPLTNVMIAVEGTSDSTTFSSIVCPSVANYANYTNKPVMLQVHSVLGVSTRQGYWTKVFVAGITQGTLTIQWERFANKNCLHT